MKKYLLISIKMTAVMIVICCVGYIGIITIIGKMIPGDDGGEKVIVDGKVVGYKLIGQHFSDDKYFWGRPSAVDYNAAGSGGSNKGPSNPEYLKIVQDRIDSFVQHNPTVMKEQIPAEMVTASASGLDPHISPESAQLQVERVARVRNINKEKLQRLVDEHTDKTILGPAVINVLELNVALDKLK